jgi:hypothetical protein
VLRCIVEHSATALRGLLGILADAGLREVAIERPDGPVVDVLLGAGITLVVVSPDQLTNVRSRYGPAGNKGDQFDAFVLADTLRTDRVRLRPLADIDSAISSACLDGAAPCTRQPGTVRTVGCRWSSDEHLREAVTDIAADSRRARTRGHDHPRAVRILDVTYDSTQHRAIEKLRQHQRPAI